MRLLSGTKSRRALVPVAGMMLGLSMSWFVPVLEARLPAPGLFLSSPGQSAVVWGTVTLSAWADATGLTDVQFQLSGGPIGAVITSGSCSRAWDTSTVPDGTYTLSALAHDTVGTPVNAPPVLVHVQNAAPEIFGVVIDQLTASSAVVRWQSQHVSDSQVDYGGSATYGSMSPLNPALVVSHSVPLSGLTGATTYHYRVRSRGTGGEVATSGDFIFVTPAGAPGAPPTPPPAPPPPAPPAPPVNVPGGCTTPDPFVALGGGTCHAGGWLPPGMPIPGSSGNGNPANVPPPAPPPAPPPPAPNSCATPDPFTALGGGTCYSGGWLPPGMPIPGGGGTPPPAPGPAPAPPAPAPSGGGFGGCVTPDPFVALGGGVCYAGNWLPPGMPIPGGSAPPVQSPPPVQPPVPPGPTPAPSTGGCITPDPFGALGGGTCYAGGWLPPGMPIPGGGVVAPPASPPPAPGPTTPGGCIGPDPFAALGGGTCYSGGWLPPGMGVPGGPNPAPPVTAPGPGQTATGMGTVRRIGSGSSAIWIIEADSGVMYQPIAGFDVSFRQVGLRVAFTGTVASGTVGSGRLPIVLASISAGFQ